MLKRKGNLSAISLDILTYPIFKYNLEKSAELAMDIMKMKLNARRLPRI
jgi:hypothetical protein